MDWIRNKNILFAHELISSSNVSDAIYETAFQQTIATHHINETTRWGLSQDCSLQKQLGEAAEGTGLAFIVFTQAIVELPGAPFWAVLFFTMLLSLGLGSQIGILEGMLCTLFDIDIFKRLRKEYVTGALTFTYFLGCYINLHFIIDIVYQLWYAFAAFLWA